MKTKITRVTYGRTVNMGNYESLRFDLTADVGRGQTFEKVYTDLRHEADVLELNAKQCCTCPVGTMQRLAPGCGAKCTRVLKSRGW